MVGGWGLAPCPLNIPNSCRHISLAINKIEIVWWEAFWWWEAGAKAACLLNVPRSCRHISLERKIETVWWEVF